MRRGDGKTSNFTVHNNGNHYDNSTGIYTVPVDGIYQFVIHIIGVGSVYGHLMVNRSQVSSSELI